MFHAGALGKPLSRKTGCMTTEYILKDLIRDPDTGKAGVRCMYCRYRGPYTYRSYERSSRHEVVNTYFFEAQIQAPKNIVLKDCTSSGNGVYANTQDQVTLRGATWAPSRNLVIDGGTYQGGSRGELAPVKEGYPEILAPSMAAGAFCSDIVSYSM